MFEQDAAKVYTCYLLKKYNIFFYNETGMVDPAFTSKGMTMDLDLMEQAPVLATSLPSPLSHLPPPLHTTAASGNVGGHSTVSPQHHLMDQLAMTTGHGLLGGKVRKSVVYPHSYTLATNVVETHGHNSHQDDFYLKKGK